MATSAEIRQQLVAALRSDLIGPGWQDVARRHEKLSQLPSVWYKTGFLVLHVGQKEAERQTHGHQLTFADLASEDASNDAANRLEKKESDDDANDSLDQANTRSTWFPSSLGMSFILERGSTLEAAVSWGHYSPPAKGEEPRLQLRKPQRVQKSFTIAGPGSSNDIPLEPNPEGLWLRWIARAAPKTLGHPSDQLSVSFFLFNNCEPPKANQIRYRDPLTAFQAELSQH